ncbi:MAG: hypothetical protein ACC652_06850 [Acidimicrobiales bacterium]
MASGLIWWLVENRYEDGDAAADLRWILYLPETFLFVALAVSVALVARLGHPLVAMLWALVFLATLSRFPETSPLLGILVGRVHPLGLLPIITLVGVAVAFSREERATTLTQSQYLLALVGVAPIIATVAIYRSSTSFAEVAVVSDLPRFVFVAGVGAAVGLSRVSVPRLLALGAVASLLSPNVLAVLWSVAGFSSGGSLLKDPLLILLVAGASVLVGDAARRSDEFHTRPLTLLIAVNAFNAADALATRLVLDTGRATEANPLVRSVGLPAKLLIVGGASYLLYRLRPQYLIWPVVALLAVLIWHLAGVGINA